MERIRSFARAPINRFVVFKRRFFLLAFYAYGGYALPSIVQRICLFVFLATPPLRHPRCAHTKPTEPPAEDEHFPNNLTLFVYYAELFGLCLATEPGRKAFITNQLNHQRSFMRPNTSVEIARNTMLVGCKDRRKTAA